MARASLLRDLPPAFRWILAGIFVNRLGSFVAPFLVLYLTQERGLSPATAGAALAVWGAGGLVATPLAGVAADRIGRRETLLACMLGAAAGLLLLGAARSTWLILLASGLAGAAAEGFRPATNAIVADLVEPAQRAHAYAMTFWATNLGFSAAALTGGALAATGWWLLFAFDAATCAVFGVLVYLRVPETRPRREDGDPAGSFRELLRDRLLLAVALLFLLQGVLLFQIFAVLPLAIDADGLSPSTFGAVLAVNGVAIILLQPLAAARLQRFSRGHVLAGALLLMGAGLWATALASSGPAFAATMLLATLGEIAFAAVSLATVADLAPAHMRGRAASIAIMAAGLAFTIAPPIGTGLFELAGEGAAWGLCGAVGLAGAAIGVAVDRPLRRRLSPGSPRPA